MSTGPDKPPASSPYFTSTTTTQHHFQHAAAPPVKAPAPAPHLTPPGMAAPAQQAESTHVVRTDGAPARVPEGMIRYAPDGRPVQPGGAEAKRLDKALEARAENLESFARKDGNGIRNPLNLTNAYDRALDRR